MTILQTSSTFVSTLQASRPTGKVFVQQSIQHDAFLPGYSGVKRVLESVGVSARSSELAQTEQGVKIEEKLKEDRNSKENFNSRENFNNKDSDDEFIDDKEASEEEEWSEEDDDSPPKKEGKSRGRKSTSSLVKKWNEWAELLVTDDDESDRLVHQWMNFFAVHIPFLQSRHSTKSGCCRERLANMPPLPSG